MNRYKLVLITLITLLLYANNTKAQDDGSVWLSALGGLNSSWIINQNAYGNPELDYSTTFGLTGGLQYSYFFKKEWGFNGSLLASKIGQNYAGKQFEGEADRKIKLSYVEVPLLVMRKLSGGKNPLWLSVGPDLMFLLKAKQEYGYIGPTPPETELNVGYLKTGDIKERYKPFDVGLNLGFNKMFEFQASDVAALTLSANASLGLTDINSTEWQMPDRKGEYKASHNFYIGIKAGFAFKVSKQ